MSAVITFKSLKQHSHIEVTEIKLLLKSLIVRSRSLLTINILKLFRYTVKKREHRKLRKKCAVQLIWKIKRFLKIKRLKCEIVFKLFNEIVGFTVLSKQRNRTYASANTKYFLLYVYVSLNHYIHKSLHKISSKTK